jgi:DNA polymerase-3 subunit beta
MASVFEIERADLAGLIDRTRFAISSEEARYYLNGLYLHLVEVEGIKKLRSVATDGHRLALAEIDAPAGSQGMGGVIIPRKTVGELRKLLEESGETVTVSSSVSKVMFDFGGVVLKSKVIDGSFPDYMRVIPRDNAGRATIDVQLLAAAVDRVSTISMEKARSIKCSFDQGVLSLAVRNMDAGQGLEEMEADFSFPAFEIGFNARYLLDVASQIQGETVVMDFGGPDAPVLLTDPTNPGVRYVIMPLRV